MCVCVCASVCVCVCVCASVCVFVGEGEEHGNTPPRPLRLIEQPRFLGGGVVVARMPVH